ncbi:MAG: M20 family metallo-hydrolase [Candidatus Natronoplasma sp.]
MIERLKEDLIKLGRFGRENSMKRVECYADLDPEKGISRPFGSEANRKARDYVVKEMRDAEMDVKIDRIGNIFGTKKGNDPDRDSILICSHIDSVVNGGMFDGALGVICGIEVIRELNEERFEHERDIEVGVFTGEEGSSFDFGLLGSSVVSGRISYDEALEIENQDGKKVREVLEEIGYFGNFEKNIGEWGYSLEMHVEQGPILEEKNVPIGIVEDITGIETMIVTIEGEADHAGTTPMDMRKDALVSASGVIGALDKKAKEMDLSGEGSASGTVGRLNVKPNETNVIPSKVKMGIDIRANEEHKMERLVREVKKELKNLEETHGVKTEAKIVSKEFPMELSEEFIEEIENSAKELDIKYKKMASRAGHDSQNIAEKIKSGMVFVPSVAGISHSPMEWTEWEDIKNGAKVMLKTVKNLC